MSVVNMLGGGAAASANDHFPHGKGDVDTNCRRRKAALHASSMLHLGAFLLVRWHCYSETFKIRH